MCTCNKSRNQGRSGHDRSGNERTDVRSLWPGAQEIAAFSRPFARHADVHRICEWHAIAIDSPAKMRYLYRLSQQFAAP